MGTWKILSNWGYNGTTELFKNGEAIRSYTNTSDSDEMVHSWYIRIGTGNAQYVSKETSTNEDDGSTIVTVSKTTGYGKPFYVTAYATGTDGVKCTSSSVIRTNADGSTTTFDSSATVENKVSRHYYQTITTTAGETEDLYTVLDSDCLKFEFIFDTPVFVAAGSTVNFYIDVNKVSASDWNVVVAQDDSSAEGGDVTVALVKLTIDPNGGKWQNSDGEYSTVPIVLTGSPEDVIDLPEPVMSGGTFTGWTLTGDGEFGSASSTFQFGYEDSTLMANWSSAATYTISYSSNSSTNSDYANFTSIPSAQTKSHGSAITLSSEIPAFTSDPISDTAFTVTLDANGGSCSTSQLQSTKLVSYEFTYWNTSSDGSGVSYFPASTYQQEGDQTLYLQADTVITLEPVTLPTPTRSKHKFLGWLSPHKNYSILSSAIAADNAFVEGAVKAYFHEFNDYGTATDGVHEDYHPEDTFVAYAFLKNEDGVPVPVIYKKNSEDSSPDYEDAFYYQGKDKIDGVAYDKWRHINPLCGLTWNATCSAFIYTDVIVSETTSTNLFNGTYTPTQDITLRAVWSSSGYVYIDNGSSFDTYTIWIDNGTSWDQYMAYIDHGDEWVPYSASSSVSTGCSHTTEILAAVAPTCTTTGLTEGSRCSECGEIIAVQNVIPALGHSWDDGVVTKEATETEEGILTYTCTTCGETKTETIPIDGHTHVYTSSTVVAATCTTTGYTLHTCDCGNSYMSDIVEATGHTEVIDAAVDGTCTTKGKTQGSHCSTCGTILVAQEETDYEHDYEQTAYVAATCTTAGYRTYRCSICGDEYTVNYPVLGHKYETVTVDATCVLDGYIESKCVRCGASNPNFEKQTISATGHSYYTTTAFCDGTYLNECSNCGHTETSEVGQGNMDSLQEEHVEILMYDDVAPTCTSVGYTGGCYCAYCGAVIQERTELPMTDHVWMEYDSSTNICEVCGATEDA